jgi:hypothetical protein
MSCNFRLAKRAINLASLTILMVVPTFSQASGFLYKLSPPSNNSNQSNPVQWLSADFENANNGVLLTISGSGLASSEFASGVYFNLDPSLNAARLVFDHVSSTGTFALPVVQQSQTQRFKADANGKYNIELNFGTANGTVFKGGDSVTYLITGIPGLTASKFEYLCLPAGGSGAFYTTACVQAQGTGSSTWFDCGKSPVPTPEPSSVALFFFALFILIAMKRFRAGIGNGKLALNAKNARAQTSQRPRSKARLRMPG